MDVKNIVLFYKTTKKWNSCKVTLKKNVDYLKITTWKKETLAHMYKDIHMVMISKRLKHIKRISTKKFFLLNLTFLQK